MKLNNFTGDVHITGGRSNDNDRRDNLVEIFGAPEHSRGASGRVCSSLRFKSFSGELRLVR